MAESKRSRVIGLVIAVLLAAWFAWDWMNGAAEAGRLEEQVMAALRNVEFASPPLPDGLGVEDVRLGSS